MTEFKKLDRVTREREIVTTIMDRLQGKLRDKEVWSTQEIHKIMFDVEVSVNLEISKKNHI